MLHCKTTGSSTIRSCCPPSAGACCVFCNAWNQPRPFRYGTWAALFLADNGGLSSGEPIAGAAARGLTSLAGPYKILRVDDRALMSNARRSCSSVSKVRARSREQGVWRRRPRSRQQLRQPTLPLEPGTHWRAIIAIRPVNRTSGEPIGNGGGTQRRATCANTVILTGARPDNPIARAPAGVRSMMRPRINGPRSEIRTTTCLPFRKFTTLTRVPNGSVR